jgi:hypothetical protein
MQMCANAVCCTIRSDSDGVIGIRRTTEENVDKTIEPDFGYNLEYTIPLRLAYSHPEVSLSKPLKAVTVSYGDNQKYTLEVSAAGEAQTVDNPLVSTVEQAEKVAMWVKQTLESRKIVKGEFRADPRLELFDVVTVESKYGTLHPVLLSYIKYTYNGSFKANYEGYVVTI